jgi:hypothetical protein
MRYLNLTWVQASINDNLKQTRNALQEFFEEQTDESLQHTIVYLSEIEGAFKIIQLQSAATLVEVMKQTVKSLKAHNNQESAYEALIKALIQLSNYLDYLLINKHDKPLALLPLINDLRACNSQTALAANSLFHPNLSVVISKPDKVVNLSDEKLKEYLQKLRVAYQKGLAAIAKNSQQPKTGLEFIATVMERLQAINSPMNKLWWVTEGIIEALLENGLKLNKTIFNLLKQLDAVITEVNAEPPRKLLTHLLYFVAHASSKGNKITAIKTTFSLDDFLDESNEIMLAVPSLEVIQITVAELNNLLIHVEEVVDDFYVNQPDSVDELEKLIPDLRQIANIYTLLKQSDIAEEVSKATNLILKISIDKKTPDTLSLFEIANTVSKAKVAINILAEQGIYANRNKNSKFKYSINTAVVKAQKNWLEILEKFAIFIETKQQDDEILNLPNQIQEMVSFLTILSHNRVAQLLAACNKHLKNFIKESFNIKQEIIYALVKILVAIKVYLEILVEQSDNNPEDIISLISDQLNAIH